MLDLFRRFFKSTLGVGVTLGLLILIALAFAAGDIAGSGGLGGLAGGDRVATVGSQKIGSAELAKGLQRGLEEARQQDPRVTMKVYLAAGGLDQTLTSITDRAAIAEFGKDNGLVAGKRLVDSELAKIPALQGIDGRFSEATYRQALAQRQLTDAEVRADIGQGLIARQVLLPAQYGAASPGSIAARYASLLKEHRTGSIGMLPSAAFVGTTPPSDAEVAAYYSAHKDGFVRPERRTIRYVAFTDAVLKNIAAPSDADIAQAYNAQKARFGASESRKVTQLVLPTEAAARAVAAEVAGGTSLDAAAKAKGLATSTTPALDRAGLAAQTSQSVADAAFGAASGKIVGPIKGPLGWEVLRVDAIEAHPAKTLEQARGELAAQITASRRRAALADVTAKIEDQFDKGGSLADAAKDLGLTLIETPPLTSDGHVYLMPAQPVAPEVGRVIKAAFQMEREGAPQLAEVEAGKTFVMFDVKSITASAAAPLAEIKGEVTAALQMEKGSAAAKAAGLKVIAATKKGQDLSAALAALGLKLPPVQPISTGREALTANNGQVPPALGLLFSMAQGTTKMIPGPRNAGWILVQLKAIQPGVIAPTDPLYASTVQELGQLAGNEYTEELRNAIRADIGVKRNETAIKAVAAQVGGSQ